MSGRQAVVLAGHGSRLGPGPAAALADHAERLRSRGVFDTVRTAFWAQEPALHDVRHAVPADDIYVVPVLTSEGYFAEEVLPRELGLDRGGDEASPRLHSTPPVGTHEAMTDVIVARVRDAVGSAPDVAVVLVGHGTERNANSARATAAHADRLRDRGMDATALFLDEAPAVTDLGEHVNAEAVVVVPFFVADGPHATTDVPAALGHPGVGETARIDGIRVTYTGAVGTHPRLADVIVERAVEAGARTGPRHAGPDPDAAAFLEWLGRTDGATWGQLAIDRTEAGFTLRHVADRDGPRSALSSLAGPAALGRLARTDTHGRYRPLSGARTLRRGWRLRGLDPADLVEAVRRVYPDSIGLWARERAGELDARSFQAAATRQTGIYASLDSIDDRRLAATVEAVCGNCVRRREWSAGAAEPVDTQRSDATIPCREPCPVVRAAAGAFADAEVDPDEPVDPPVPAGAFDQPGNATRVDYARALDRRREPVPAAGRREDP